MPGSILIIDDDPVTRIVLADRLTARGYQPIVAADGLEALTYLQGTETLPNLILLDLRMPRMGGWQFLTAQRHDPGLAVIPVVLLSAADDLDRNAAALKVGEYLEKPIRAADLLDVAALLRVGRFATWGSGLVQPPRLCAPAAPTQVATGQVLLDGLQWRGAAVALRTQEAQNLSHALDVFVCPIGVSMQQVGDLLQPATDGLIACQREAWITTTKPHRIPPGGGERCRTGSSSGQSIARSSMA